MKHIHKRKSYLPAFVIMVILWFATLFIFFTIPPQSFLIIGLFLLLLSLAVFVTLSLLLANSKISLLATGILTLLIVLKKLGRLNIVNIALIIVIFFIFNQLFKKR